MNSVFRVSTLVLVCSSMVVASSTMYQKYGEESGKIEYRLTSSMNMMGIKGSTTGSRDIIFSEYGAKELKDEKKVVKQNRTTTKTHIATYMDKSMVYTINYDTKKIMRMQAPGMAMMGLSDENTAQQAGLKMLKQMGGKKIGRDSILGYSCDLWEAMGTKQCIYKGIPLSLESDIMGVKSREVATKIEFGIDIPAEAYTLPQFPIYDMQGNKIERSSLAAMDAKGDAQVTENSRDMAALGASLATAMQSAGVAKGETPTKVQEKDIEASMMSAMLPRMKEKFISQEKVMLFGKECLSKADKLKEANICNQKANAMSGEDEEPFDAWNPKIKKDILNSLDKGLQSVECMKKANSMDAERKCMSHE